MAVFSVTVTTVDDQAVYHRTIFLLNESNIAVHDPDNVLRKYTDKNTTSGGVIERQFCGTCGSPVLSLVLADPGTVCLKASLLDIADIPQPKEESFLHKEPQWMDEVNYL